MEHWLHLWWIWCPAGLHEDLSCPLPKFTPLCTLTSQARILVCITFAHGFTVLTSRSFKWATLCQLLDMAQVLQDGWSKVSSTSCTKTFSSSYSAGNKTDLTRYSNNIMKEYCIDELEILSIVTGSSCGQLVEICTLSHGLLYNVRQKTVCHDNWDHSEEAFMFLVSLWKWHGEETN